MPDVIRVAHLSDPHIMGLEGLRPLDLLSKRAIGYLNIKLNRARLHRLDLAKAVVRAMREQDPHHVVITGDLGNLALVNEYVKVAQWLAGLGMDPGRVTVVPGNHDAYVVKALRQGHFRRILSDYIASDPEFAAGSVFGFPVARRRGSLFILGLNTALPSPPLMAWGRLGETQLQEAERLLCLARTEGLCRVVALHHPPQPEVTRFDNGLRDAEAFRRMLARAGAELVLHGHMHRPMEARIQGPRGSSIPVLGTGSASLSSPLVSHRAQFRMILLSGKGLVESRLFVHDEQTSSFRVL